jgi:hypothetical protein
MWWRRNKRDAAAHAADIKARYEAKRVNQGLFTPAQEELMEELGLTPGQPPKIKDEKHTKNTKARDPLTARQRKLAKELGLLKED